MNAFHKTKKSAAVLKHAILDQYATPFASKTGSTSVDHRVAFIDGYAGPGRYDDGQEGSGAMLLRKARELAAMNSSRRIELHLAEQDPTTVAKLREVVKAEGNGVAVTVTDGDISTHLPGLLNSASGVPLFVYLDPCGLIIPLDEVASIFERPSGPGTPATEVLINLTAHLRRFAGMLTSDTPVEASLRRIDDVCGGSWWRKAWTDRLPDREAAEQAVVEGYAHELRKRAGGAGTWIIDVRPRADLRPLYYLVFATRHVDGMFTFGESASLGLKQWRRYHAELAAEGTLFSESNAWEKAWQAQERALDDQWVDTIAERLSNELSKGSPFRIIDRPSTVMGDLVGVVRTKHLRAAIDRCRREGKTSTETRNVKNVSTLRLTPA